MNLCGLRAGRPIDRVSRPRAKNATELYLPLYVRFMNNNPTALRLRNNIIVQPTRRIGRRAADYFEHYRSQPTHRVSTLALARRHTRRDNEHGRSRLTQSES